MYSKVQAFIAGLTRPRKPIDEEKEVLIDASHLTCPVCYNVFVSAPLVLPCGHSFCSSCCSQLNRSHSTANCPMCRKPFIRGKTYAKNYALECILQSVTRVPDDADSDVYERWRDNQMKFTVARLKQEVQQERASHTATKKTLQEREATMRALVAVIITVSLITLAMALKRW